MESDGRRVARIETAPVRRFVPGPNRADFAESC